MKEFKELVLISEIEVERPPHLNVSRIVIQIGRQPHFLANGRFSKFWEDGPDPIFFINMEDNHNFMENGTQPKF